MHPLYMCLPKSTSEMQTRHHTEDRLDSLTRFDNLKVLQAYLPLSHNCQNHTLIPYIHIHVYIQCMYSTTHILVWKSQLEAVY